MPFTLYMLLLLTLQQGRDPLDPLTVEEYVSLRRADHVSVSPDGGSVAFAVRDTDLKGDRFVFSLQVWDASAEIAAPAATGFASLQRSRWSPGGDWLAFAGAREPDAPAGLWLVSALSAGAPKAIEDVPAPVVDYDWGPDDVLFVLVGEVGDDAGPRTGDRPATGREIWRVTPEGDAQRLWVGGRRILDIAVSPVGDAIAISSTAGSDPEHPAYDLGVLDLTTLNTRRLTSRAGAELEPVWSPDGNTIVFRAPRTPDHPFSQMGLFRVPAGGGSPALLTGSFDREVIEHIWPQDGDLLFTAALGAHTHVFALRGNGAVEVLAAGAYNFSRIAAGRDGRPVYGIRESTRETPQLCRIARNRVEILTSFNDAARRWQLARQDIIRWQAPDGLTIEGLLVYPVDFQGGRRYPLLVNPAGGPGRRVRDVLLSERDYQLFAAHGYAVLAASSRGSAGYGEAFNTAQRSDLAGGELVDVLEGIDEVIELGLVDSTRIAVFGEGYGATLAVDAIRRALRFQAAALLYGLGPEETKPGRGGPPLEIAQPPGSLTDVPTPVLLAYGPGTDPALVAELRRTYSGLRSLGRPVELVSPSDTATGMSPHAHIDLFFRQLRWFDRYLKLDGADRFDFYFVEEWVPGPGGWQWRVIDGKPRSDFSGIAPTSGRYLEIRIRLQADPAPGRRARELSLDLQEGIRLTGPDDSRLPLTGTVTEVFGQETLIMGPPGSISIPAPGAGAPSVLDLHLAFTIPDTGGEYWLRLEDFPPVRIWLPEGN